MSVGKQFRRHKGLFDGLSPTKQISMSLKLNCETLYIGGFLASLRSSGDGSVGNERRQGTTLCTCNWKKPRGVVLKKETWELRSHAK